MPFEPGTYYLINVKHAQGKFPTKEPIQPQESIESFGHQVAAMDLSEGNDQSIIAFGWHGGENQRWQFEPAGNGNYYIKNVKYSKYITFPDEPEDGKQVIATDGPREWEVRVGHEGVNVDDEAESIRIFVPGTEKNLDLTNHGDITPGTPVQLWEQTPGKGQAWYFVRV
ncbi:unnamed protein product [Rhizoctonia solani]|uniref:Ricin B lectin domain-containing protein n=3 Tax=Rhizoctonia solani TaxID=456999 RepID=A0A8H3H453_9AGAM